jgi:uncharacterized membrane protein
MGKRISSFVRSPENFFFAAGLLFGISLVVLIPPFQAPDEWMHFRRACQISEGQMIPDRYVAEAAPLGSIERENVGGDIPKGFIIAEKFAFFSIPYDERIQETVLNTHGLTEDPFQAGRKFNKKTILSLFRQPPAGKQRDLIFFPNAAMHSPHLYVPQAFGIALDRLLGYPPIASLYMGRFFNLLVWLCLVYCAIRITPTGKWLFLVLALTPTSLFQSSSLSADAVTNGLAMLLVALFLRYAYGAGKVKNMLPAIFVLSALVAVSKLYFFLVFLFLLIPKEKFRDRKTYWAAFFLLLLTTAITVVSWAYLVRNLYVPFKAGISPKDQIVYVLQHPIIYLSTCWHTLLVNGKYYVMSFVGRFGHFSFYLPARLIWVHAAVLIFISATADVSGIVVRGGEKLLLGAVFLAGTFWILVVQYLSGTEVGATVIDGVQGRYFIPVAPLLLLLFSNRKFGGERRLQIVYTMTACYVVLLLAATSLAVVKGYYY